MSQQNKIQVIDGSGWRKDYVVDKNLIYIGSSAENDVVLDAVRGGGVAPRHIQLIPFAANGNGYRLINLGNQDIILGANEPQVLQPRSFIDISDGQQITLGEFTLIFHRGLGGSFALGSDIDQNTSQAIGLSISLANTRLAPDRPLEGGVIVRNLGEATGAQFKVTLEGLEASDYELEPGPILFPNAEAELFLRLSHPRRPSPPAGSHRISIHATAPDAYPGQRVTVSKIIDILPFFSHKLRLEALNGH